MSVAHGNQLNSCRHIKVVVRSTDRRVLQRLRPDNTSSCTWLQPDKNTVDWAHEQDPPRPDGQEVWPWQEMSAMMVFPSARGETPGGSDVTVRGHKQQSWKVQTGLKLGRLVRCYPSITNHVIADFNMTPTRPGSPQAWPHQEGGHVRHSWLQFVQGTWRVIWDYSGPGWSWPGLVFTLLGSGSNLPLGRRSQGQTALGLSVLSKCNITVE